MEEHYGTSEEIEIYAMDEIEMNTGMSYIKYQHNIVHPRPTRSSGGTARPKRRKRANSKVSRVAAQELSKIQSPSSPKLTRYSERLAANNPFDDGLSKPRQPIPKDMEGRAVEQRKQLRDVSNDQLPKSMGPMGSPTSTPSERMSRNKGHLIKPTANHTMDSNLLQNSMAQNLQENQLSMQQLGQMNLMDNLRINTIVDEFHSPSANDNTENLPLDLAMKSRRTEPSPVNAPRLSLDDDANITLAEKIREFGDNDFGFEPVTVEQLMSLDLIAIDESIPIDTPISEWKSPEDGKSAAPIFSNLTENRYPEQSDLQSAMALEQRASEKIYPGNEPMVIDYEDPLAIPIYPCGVCRREVRDDDEGVVCESGCKFWFHRQCLGLSELAFQLLTGDLYVEWACDNCLRTKNLPMVKFKP